MQFRQWNDATLKQRTLAAQKIEVQRQSMQRFIAELSGVIDKLELERSWKSDLAVDPTAAVTFDIAGKRVSITINSNLSNQWKSDSFHRTFSSAIHRLDQRCNIRWL